jgi:hypothetical protein
MVDMVVMAADGEEGEMTVDEVIAEVMAHLGTRRSVKDPLIPMANFFAMMTGGQRRPYSNAQDMVCRRWGGSEAIEQHRKARQERKAAYEAELLAAYAAGLSLAAVAQSYGHSKVSYDQLRRIGCDIKQARLDPEHVRRVARVGMSIADLAVAAGYHRSALSNWLARGHLDVLFVMRKRKNNVFYVAKVRKGGAA